MMMNEENKYYKSSIRNKDLFQTSLQENVAAINRNLSHISNYLFSFGAGIFAVSSPLLVDLSKYPDFYSTRILVTISWSFVVLSFFFGIIQKVKIIIFYREHAAMDQRLYSLWAKITLTEKGYNNKQMKTEEEQKDYVNGTGDLFLVLQGISVVLAMSLLLSTALVILY
jgi:hypothetical protein